MSYAVILFVGLVWLPGGTVQPPIARVFVSMEECHAAAVQFEADIATANAGNAPTMQISSHWSCAPVLNDSVREPA